MQKQWLVEMTGSVKSTEYNNEYDSPFTKRFWRGYSNILKRDKKYIDKFAENCNFIRFVEDNSAIIEAPSKREANYFAMEFFRHYLLEGVERPDDIYPYITKLKITRV